MALSFYSDFGYLHQENLTNVQQTHQYSDIKSGTDILGCCYDNNSSFGFLDNFIGTPSLETPDDQFYSDQDSYTNLLPYFSSPDDEIVTLSPEMFSPKQEFDSFNQYPKRQKSCQDFWLSGFEPTCYDRFSEYSSPMVTELVPEVTIPAVPLLPKLEGPLPTVFTEGIRTESVKKPSRSAQSIAARERRRKVTEKTHELGKLIPGGNKMNTAEMFQAAAKYAKFLQTQVQMLELMGSIEERDGTVMHTQDLDDLLVSPVVLEKLYSEEKCLVPTEFVQTVLKNEAVRSKPLIFEEIVQLTLDRDKLMKLEGM